MTNGRCGCPDCLNLIADCGIAIDYERAHQCDNYTFRFDGECVAGDGLRWDAAARKLDVKLKPGGGLGFDGDGALHTTDQPFPPEGASVEALQERRVSADVVVAGYGGGYMIKPQSTRAGVEYAVERGVDAVHLPVRMLHDGTPVITPDTHMGPQNGNRKDFGKLVEVQQQDVQRWRDTQNGPGIWNHSYPWTEQGVPVVDWPKHGWFGYLENNEDHLVTLAEAAEIVEDRAVLVLELLWPPIKPDGTAWNVHTTPTADFTDVTDRRVELFLKHIRRVVGYHGLTRSVIVTTQNPTVPTRDPQVQRAVLDDFARAGITVGPSFYTPQQAAQYPPSAPEWQTWSWVFAMCDNEPGAEPRPDTMPAGLPPATVKTYTSAGKYALWFPVTRHSEFERLVKPAGAVGVISADPEYTAGNLPINKMCPTCGDNPYRKHDSTFHFSTVEHGLLPLRDEAWWQEVSAVRRGFMPLVNTSDGQIGQYILGTDADSGSTDTFFVLQGWANYASEDTQNYRLRFRFDVERMAPPPPLAREVRAEVAFAVGTDHRLQAWHGERPQQDRTGYILSSVSSKPGEQWAQVVRLWCWDPAQGEAGGNLLLHEWAAAALDPIEVTVLVDETRLWVSPTAPGWTPPAYDTGTEQDANKKFLGSADSGNRGGYVYFGRGRRGDYTEGDSERARFAAWSYEPGAGTPDPGTVPARALGYGRRATTE